jgi:predicted nucleotidyltransferase
MTGIHSLNIPSDIADGLSRFVDACREVLDDSLVAIVLFGSAAEGRLRATSDVNLMLVLQHFDPQRMAALADALNLARSTMRLSTMLILENELTLATNAFAEKFADIIDRHQLLYGRDVLVELAPTREAMRIRLRQILLNFVLRNREHYATLGQREEQLATVVADAAAPLRSAAAMILELRGQPAASPKAALEALTASLDTQAWQSVLTNLSAARESGRLPPGDAPRTLLNLIYLAQHLLKLTHQLA